MLPGLSVEHRSWPLATPFRISRGVKTAAEVVAVQVSDGLHVGRGESVPYARYGETVASVIEEVRLLGDRTLATLTRDELGELLPAGAARNALDCALWDLEARRSGRPVAELLGQPVELPSLASAQTVSLDTPEAMGRAAATLQAMELVKIKVDAQQPAAQIRAVRHALPDARLIVDPNESWTLDLLRELQPVLVETRIDLVEQPLPADEDGVLEGFASAVRLCADESCHVAADLPRLRRRYQVVNIKLDKTGGLTEALRLLEAARAQDFGVMVGCMVCPSLAIAPAWHVARHAEFVDLDGPIWLREDHPGGVQLRDGRLLPASPSLWGAPLPA